MTNSNETIDQDTGEVKTSTALSLNNNEMLSNLQKEVMEEFITSDREVYKEALRSLLVSEQKLERQITEIENEIADLQVAKAALDEAFRNGTLHSAQDARGIVRTVGQRTAKRNFDDLED